MTKRTAIEIVNQVQRKQSVPAQPEYDLWGIVEIHIQDFLEKQKDWCDKVHQEGWLGEKYVKGKNGLLGYLRTSFAIQLKTLQNLQMPVPIYSMNAEIVNFFRSDWFRNATIENGFVKPIYKKEHFEFLKSEKKQV